MSRPIKDWPAADRPVHKLLDRGPEVLSDAELLAVVLRHGRRGLTAVDLGRSLIRRYGDFRQLGDAGLGELCVETGVGRPQAALVVAVLEIARRHGESAFRMGQPFRGSGDVYAHFRERLATERRECFYAVLLDNKHRKIKDVAVSQGSLTASIVHPRDVFAPVVRESAAAVIFVHNHPSGDPTPSSEDVYVTRQIVEAGKLLSIDILDHLVMGQQRWVSLKERGMGF